MSSLRALKLLVKFGFGIKFTLNLDVMVVFPPCASFLFFGLHLLLPALKIRRIKNHQSECFAVGWVSLVLCCESREVNDGYVYMSFESRFACMRLYYCSNMHM